MPDESYHVLDLLPAYALGSLEVDEALQVEDHLVSCWICRRESGAFQTVAEQLSIAVSPVNPPPELKERLMRSIQGSQAPQQVPDPVSRQSWLERLLPVWGLASLALIILLGIFSLALWQRIDHLELAISPGGMRAVPLNATDEIPNATGFVIVGVDGRNGALVVDGLPPLDDAHQYQLWLDRDGTRTSGAVFSTDEQNYGGTRIRAPGSLLEYSAVVVTVEPTGGSPQPTGAVVLDGFLFNP
jgi:anti-sigma-K factor RskA